MAYTCVQSRSAASNQVTSAALAFSSNVTAGNTILLAISNWDRAPTSVADNLGNTYTLVDEAIFTGTVRMYLYRAYNIAGGACTITVQHTPAEDMTLAIHEYSGLLTTDPFDVSDDATGTTGTTYSVGPTATTNQAEELVFVCGNNDGSATTPTNFTDTLNQRQNINTSADMPILTGDKRITATGAQSESWSWANGGDRAMIIATFKENTGGGPTPETAKLLPLLGVG